MDDHVSPARSDEMLPVQMLAVPSQLDVHDRGNATRPYPSAAKFAAVMVGVCLTFALIGLDSTILAVAIPAITRSFGTMYDVGWYLAVYRLMSGSFQLLSGKLYSILPSRPLFLSSLAAFFVGSLLSALAPASPAFIVGRAITGLATAGVTSGAFAVIIESAPLRTRSTYAGIAAAIEAIASMTAPLLGGALIDRLTWRWCFFIELPLIGVILIDIALFSKRAKHNNDDDDDHDDDHDDHDGLDHGPRGHWRQLDFLGTALFLPAFVSLILALQWGGSRYAWTDWRVLVLLAAFVALIVLFAWVQRRKGERSTLPPRVALRRSVLFGFLFSFCNNGALSVVEYYMPTYLQTVRGLSATRSAVMVIPTGAGLALSVPLAGVLTSRFGYCNPFMLLDSLVTPVAIGLLTTLKPHMGAGRILAYQALLGLGAGIGFQGPQVALQAVLADKDAQMGIAIIQLAQALGPAVAVAAAQAIFTSRLGSRSEGSPYPANDSQLGPATTEDAVMAYNSATTEAFYLPLGLACATVVGALGVEWRTVKQDR